jgi:hypothetical protein
MYELDTVIKFAKAPLRGYTALVVDGESSDWTLMWYTPRAEDGLRKFIAMTDQQLLALVKPA